MSFPSELRHLSFSNRILVNMFDNDAHPKYQTKELCFSFEVQMMQDETRHCEMMHDGVAEMLNFCARALFH
jgi:hypothetical protein